MIWAYCIAASNAGVAVGLTVLGGNQWIAILNAFVCGLLVAELTRPRASSISITVSPVAKLAAR